MRNCAEWILRCQHHFVGELRFHPVENSRGRQAAEAATAEAAVAAAIQTEAKFGRREK